MFVWQDLVSEVKSIWPQLIPSSTRALDPCPCRYEVVLPIIPKIGFLGACQVAILMFGPVFVLTVGYLKHEASSRPVPAGSR